MCDNCWLFDDLSFLTNQVYLKFKLLLIHYNWKESVSQLAYYQPIILKHIYTSMVSYRKEIPSSLDLLPLGERYGDKNKAR